MRRTGWFTTIAALILIGSPALADNIPLSQGSRIDNLTGDSPPSTVYTFRDHGGLVCDAIGAGASGTLTIAGIPALATVSKAFFVTGAWDALGFPSHSMSLTFNGNAYGDVNASVVDPGVVDSPLDLGGYIVDVTADVTGNGIYAFSAVPLQAGSGLFGSLLAVVYADPGSPSRQVLINFGAESIQNSSSTSSFAGIDGGPGTLHVFTQADQGGTSAGEESISFNGVTITGGPDADIFNNNRGQYASYFELPVDTTVGDNTVRITTGEDWFGWHFAALVSPFVPTQTKPTTWGRIKALYR